MSRTWCLVLLALVAPAVLGAERRQTLPPTPPPVAISRSGHVQVAGANLYYAVTGSGPTVLLLQFLDGESRKAQ